MFSQWFHSLFDSTSSSCPDTSAPTSSDSTDTRVSEHESSVRTSEPSAFNAWGVAASDFQCASETPSVSPSFSCTQDTWGTTSDGASSWDTGSSFDRWT